MPLNLGITWLATMLLPEGALCDNSLLVLRPCSDSLTFGHICAAPVTVAVG